MPVILPAQGSSLAMCCRPPPVLVSPRGHIIWSSLSPPTEGAVPTPASTPPPTSASEYPNLGSHFLGGVSNLPPSQAVASATTITTVCEGWAGHLVTQVNSRWTEGRKGKGGCATYQVRGQGHCGLPAEPLFWKVSLLNWVKNYLKRTHPTVKQVCWGLVS